MLLSFNTFRGMAPRIAPERLAKGFAVIAKNCRFDNGNLRPAFANVPVKALARTVRSVFRLGRTQPDDTLYWLGWAAAGVKAVYGAIAGDTSERLYFTGDGPPKVTNLQLAVNGATVFPNVSYRLGIPAPASAPTVAKASTSSATDLPVDRFYAVTYVSAWGEEGPPSPASSILAVKPGESVQLSNIPVAPTGAYQISTKRIYCSTEAVGGSDVLVLVGEIPVAQASFTHSTAITGNEEQISTLDYDMPPDSLAGLIELPNGVMAGYAGNDVLFCEPYLPYAWPKKYGLSAGAPIVGLGHFGQTLVVLTKGQPYLVTGVDPAGMSMERADLPQACVSAASIASIGAGVIYASPDGLCYIGDGGAKVLTQPLMAREDWQAIAPDTMQGFWQDNAYVALVTVAGQQRGYVFSDLFTDQPSMSTFDTDAVTGFVDLQNDALYLANITGTITKFGMPGAGLASMQWRGAPVRLDGVPPFPWLRVLAASYPASVSLIADGTTIPLTVASSMPVRTPLGWVGKLQLEVQGGGEVEAVQLAHDSQEFAGGGA